ncbi:MAG TPA: calcium/sodium antiporter [Rhizomicrobium sp.]|nr:calcium/sodium antiporter [Rhizomicrobium sp.]
MAYGFVGIGILLLLLGSEALLHGGIGLSKSLGFPPLLIGLVVVSAATSAPELSVALQAARTMPDIAIGDVVGSNIVNLFLILGLGALMRPLPSPPKVVFRDGGTMLLAGVALAVIAMIGVITRQLALFLLAGFVAYLVLSFVTEWHRPSQLSATEERAHCRTGSRAPGLNLFLVVFGVAALFFGARCLIDGGLAVADIYHLPPAMIALTLIALATSAPELVITLVALARRHSDIAVGHLIASNIFNLLVVLGLTALVQPLAISPVFAHADILVMVGASALLMPLMIASWRLSRANGTFLVLCYAGYGAFLAWRMGYLVLPHFG